MTRGLRSGRNAASRSISPYNRSITGSSLREMIFAAFDQLRAGGFKSRGRQLHERLIQDLNQHVRGLSAEAEKNRTALRDADEKLRDAKFSNGEPVTVQVETRGRDGTGHQGAQAHAARMVGGTSHRPATHRARWAGRLPQPAFSIP